jgi:lysophosphatidylcholine acyltransferase/lyso-PAF acetyltransferase
VDYSKYLGENYIKAENSNKEKEIIPSIHICNHTSWLEILIFMSLIGTGFLAKIDVKSYPLIGLISENLGSVFVDRDNKNTLGETLDIINQKQKNIFLKKDLSKFMIFPEGTTSNNVGILDFKRGAFLAELPVKPYVVKFETCNKISLAMDVIEMLYHLFFIICVPVHFVEVIELPVFVPNENLFKDSKKERWLQYAEAVKDAMCEASGLKKLQGSYKEKKESLDYLRDKNRGKLN